MKDLQKYFTIKIKGHVFVPTIDERNYTYRVNYDIENTIIDFKYPVVLNLCISYPIIKDEYTKEGWKGIKDGIKENLIITIKRHEVALKRKELFGVWNH